MGQFESYAATIRVSRVGGELLPQAKEFKYLGVLLMIDGKMDHEMDRWIGAASGGGSEEGAEPEEKAFDLPINRPSNPHLCS